MTISERIFSLLDVQGKKQGALADYIGVRPATISAWKQKQTSPASDLLEKIAEYFDVSVDYLVTGREPQHPIVAQGIFGDENHHNVVTINGTAALELSEFETELLQIFGELSTRQKNALLSYAYELKEGKA
ncbi:helix-turn-helix domain-containing protein [Pumilibacter muris]|uniref:helix-turn-helix domain-containing protein n=1 Tax=Pumilibacter muris TaxID=2941510 RepID=UPI00203E8D3A|nr:helix-turn-helix domain-containing protein [Pumilibacter muris]